MQGIQVQQQDVHDAVSHSWFPGQRPFATLNFGEPLNGTALYFHETAQVDAVMEELAMIRALLAGPSCPAVAEHSRRRCEMDDGHDGAHRSGLVAWGPGVTEPAPEPLKGAERLAALIAGTAPQAVAS